MKKSRENSNVWEGMDYGQPQFNGGNKEEEERSGRQHEQRSPSFSADAELKSVVKCKVQTAIKDNNRKLPTTTIPSISVFSHMASLFFFFTFRRIRIGVFLLICIVLASFPYSVHCWCKNPPIIFNFGDSNSDTGGLVSGLGFQINLPNGRSFFRRSTGRLSDGRLILDFLCKFFFSFVIKFFT